MIKLKMDAKVSGPIFSPQAPQIVRQAGEATVQELLEKGEERLSEVLRPRPKGVYLSRAEAAPGKSSTGHYRRSISTKRTGLSGVINDGGVVYGAWLEGQGSRNLTTRFKGYASFRRVKQWLESIADNILDKQKIRLLRRLG